MVRMTAAWVGFIATLCWATVAWTDEPRIAVLQPDDELLRGISLALAPWGIQTVSSNAPLPQSSQPEAVRVASGLSRQLGVEALVWITRLDQGSLLWVFDVRTGDVTTRLLSETPPFDGAAAAAVALSVKTVLRATAVAPPAERFGSQPSEPPPAPLITPEHHVAALEFGAGGHWISDGELDLRAKLAGVLWLPAAPSLGLSLELSSGPGLSIHQPEYSGRYREVVAGLRARFRLIDADNFATLIGLGAGAHWARLKGTLTTEAQQSTVDRLNTSLDVDTAFHFYITQAFYLGAALGATYSPSYRRYLVRGNPIFSPRPLTANLTGYCGVELF